MDTFVVRIWHEREQGPAAALLRGTVLHVASGEMTPFAGIDQLLAFFQKADVQDTGSGSPEYRSAAAT